MLKTNVCDERVCSTETSGTTLTPENSSPHCVAECGVSGFNGHGNRFENLNCFRGPRSLFACPLLPSHLHLTKRDNGDQRIGELVSVLQTTIFTNVEL